MLRAFLKLEEENEEEAKRVYLAAFYGDVVEDSRVKVKHLQKGKEIIFEIEAKDPVAMRAVLNSILRNYKLICSLKDV